MNKSEHLCLELIHPYLLTVNEGAVLMLAHITSLSSLEDVSPYVCELPGRLLTRLEQLWPVVTFQSIPVQERPGSGFAQLPSELYQTSGDLNRMISRETQAFVRLVATVLTNLHSTSLFTFLDCLEHVLRECPASLRYQLTVVMSLILIKASLPSILDFFFLHLCGETVFNPKCTVFGPMTLDPLLSALRSAVVELMVHKAAHLLLRLIPSCRAFPFLVSDIFGRVLGCTHNSFPMLCTRELIKEASNASIGLADVGAPSDAAIAPRSANILFVFDNVVFYRCVYAMFQ
jgi:hypothetical protein